MEEDQIFVNINMTLLLICKLFRETLSFNDKLLYKYFNTFNLAGNCMTHGKGLLL